MLLERDSHLASLAEYARDAGHGHGRLVLVAGEAGVGKSALVERLQREVPEARWPTPSFRYKKAPDCRSNQIRRG